MTNPETLPFSVLIVAGGTGSRIGGETPKQYQKIGNISVLEQSIEKFFSCKTLKQIRLVCDPLHSGFLSETVMAQITASPAPAGKNRKESVFNGLISYSELKSEDIILIHDAARPLICTTDIENLVRAVAVSGAATLAVPVADTLTRTDGTNIDRNDLWSIQTPQGFRYGLIREAHEKFKDSDDFTDDASLVRALGHSVTLVPGSRQNFKITTPDDLEMARKLMPCTMPETRTALGFDVHGFDLTRPGPIRLGGVDIPYHCKLAGHSDADVGLHAITDALLGTIAAGDIGQHFPPSDPQWKGMDSSFFLKRAVAILHEKNAVIILIDLTFMCEEPKIGPHREAMQRVIAEITGLTPDRISIKATTTEKLGFTGRKEGIAAQALATISLPL
jgi:2-C-methyl-D-erythritol 4-phosphate cytidylyltransferase/2-C-methyl-D-erythritol 2,4-cyclodiphosphate synthase